MPHFFDGKRCVDDAEAGKHGLIYCKTCGRQIGFRVALAEESYSIFIEPKFRKFEDEISEKFAHKTGNSFLETEMRQIIESVKEMSIVDDECAFYDEEPIEERGVLQ